MFIVYTDHLSKRLEYIVKHIFLNMAEITDNKERFLKSEKFKINYAVAPLSPMEFHLIPATNLLFEQDIKQQDVKTRKLEDGIVFFPTAGAADFSFDVFAAAFYVLSRYEEYLPFVKDKHGRFRPEDSLAYSKGLLNRPFVDKWIDFFIKTLNQKFNTTFTSNRVFSFIPTIDVDIAFAYKSKGIYRSLFGYLKSIYGLNFKELYNRAAINLNIMPDPYDTFDYIIDLHAKHNLPTIFFIHVGDYGHYDKNAAYKDPKFRQLIRHLADYAEIGIHPSYASADKPEKMAIEIERLSEIVRKEVTKSRQHFLRINMPHTYRYLADCHILEDYTMGFASYVGFRAGTCKPFRFFDLDRNETGGIVINPFSIMEGTLHDYMKSTTEEALEIIKKQLTLIKENNGVFMSLFHNESLSEIQRWKGWRHVYEQMLESIIEK